MLFAGCLVKSADARTLGCIKETDQADRPATLANPKSRLPESRIILPGHGDPGGWELVENTPEAACRGREMTP
ncbi:hypothetical protein [Desulfobacter sp. UBA2225]|uniref:hypothetical protein n=1 Tax=Desulfobacter sp. UBA2225 TaxID=1961413 RepID=UPI00257B6507|nr:hypothetical protein [Desulfobacter sp. UBA2225]